MRVYVSLSSCGIVCFGQVPTGGRGIRVVRPSNAGTSTTVLSSLTLTLLLLFTTARMMLQYRSLVSYRCCAYQLVLFSLPVETIYFNFNLLCGQRTTRYTSGIYEQNLMSEHHHHHYHILASYPYRGRHTALQLIKLACSRTSFAASCHPSPGLMMSIIVVCHHLAGQGA